MRFEDFAFGRIQVDGTVYDHDLVIDHGKIEKCKKRPSKKYRESFGHTPLSVEEDIPWNCGQLVIGTGMGALPVMNEVRQEARRRGVKLVIRPTGKAIQILNEQPKDTNAILHLTCLFGKPRRNSTRSSGSVGANHALPTPAKRGLSATHGQNGTVGVTHHSMSKAASIRTASSLLARPSIWCHPRCRIFISS